MISTRQNKNKILLSIIAIAALSSSIGSFCMMQKAERLLPIVKCFYSQHKKPKYLEVKEGKIGVGGINISPFYACRPTLKITDYYKIAGERLEGVEHAIPKDLEKLFESEKPALDFLLKTGVYVKDKLPCFYIYEQIKNGKIFSAIICLVAIKNYFSGMIKPHENIIPERVELLEKFVGKEKVQSNPVLFLYESCPEIKAIIEECTKGNCAQKFVLSDGTEHKIWVVNDKRLMAAIEKVFSTIPTLDVADGHHRLGVACSMYHKERAYRYLLSALIASDNIGLIEGFSRVIEGLNNAGKKRIEESVYNNFDVKKLNLLEAIKFSANSGNSQKSVNSENSGIFDIGPGAGLDIKNVELQKSEYIRQLVKSGAFCMFSNKDWHAFRPRPGVIESRLKDPVKQLPVSILHEFIDPVLFENCGAKVKYVGGDVERKKIEAMCSKSENDIGFAIPPVSMDQFKRVVNNRLRMPPKSTCFPKIPSGIILNKL